jgi:hypothetical protein
METMADYLVENFPIIMTFLFVLSAIFLLLFFLGARQKNDRTDRIAPHSVINPRVEFVNEAITPAKQGWSAKRLAVVLLVGLAFVSLDAFYVRPVLKRVEKLEQRVSAIKVNVGNYNAKYAEDLRKKDALQERMNIAASQKNKSAYLASAKEFDRLEAEMFTEKKKIVREIADVNKEVAQLPEWAKLYVYQKYESAKPAKVKGLRLAQ